MAKRIIIAGGGTGGHIFPAIAIANAMKEMDSAIEILFVGAKGRMEMEKIPEAGYPIKGLDIAGFNRSSLLKNFSLPFKLIRSFFQVRNIFRDFQPQAAIGVGGYSSFPVLRLAQAKRIPTFIHESNSFAGKSNMMLGRKAKKIFVATDGMEKFFPKDRIMITGNPVRPGITNAATINKSEALASFGLKEGKKTVLVVGGGLGARTINESVYQHLDELLAEGLQVIWQTGRSDAAKWKLKSENKTGVWTSEFISRMDHAYGAADIVVARAGAITIAELSAVKKPVLFVPYPFAAEDHQTANARKLVEKHAALMVSDAQALEKLVPVLIALAKNENQQTELKNNIGKQALPGADKKIAEEILKSI